MNSSSERLVVFVTPAQKRVLAARAARMGISLSELVRRAVLAFDDTGEEVRAAGLVDRLGAARTRAVDADPVRRLVSGQAAQTLNALSQPAGVKRAPERGPRQSSPADTPLTPSTAGGTVSRGAAGRACSSPGAGGENGAALPVAAAVAQALALQAEAQAQAHARPDPDDEASVARLIAQESRDLSGF